MKTYSYMLLSNLEDEFWQVETWEVAGDSSRTVTHVHRHKYTHTFAHICASSVIFYMLWQDVCTHSTLTGKRVWFIRIVQQYFQKKSQNRSYIGEWFSLWLRKHGLFEPLSSDHEFFFFWPQMQSLISWNGIRTLSPLISCALSPSRFLPLYDASTPSGTQVFPNAVYFKFGSDGNQPTKGKNNQVSWLLIVSIFP